LDIFLADKRKGTLLGCLENTGGWEFGQVFNCFNLIMSFPIRHTKVILSGRNRSQSIVTFFTELTNMVFPYAGHSSPAITSLPWCARGTGFRGTGFRGTGFRGWWEPVVFPLSFLCSILHIEILSLGVRAMIIPFIAFRAGQELLHVPALSLY
jgi:hypothetical protein